MCPRGGRGQRAKRAGVGGGWPAKKVREWADAHLANLRIYPPAKLSSTPGVSAARYELDYLCIDSYYCTC